MIPEFDPYAEPQSIYDVCDLIPGTKDGFPDSLEQAHYDSGPDPPSSEYIDPPHFDPVFNQVNDFLGAKYDISTLRLQNQ